MGKAWIAVVVVVVAPSTKYIWIYIYNISEYTKDVSSETTTRTKRKENNMKTPQSQSKCVLFHIKTKNWMEHTHTLLYMNSNCALIVWNCEIFVCTVAVRFAGSRWNYINDIRYVSAVWFKIVTYSIEEWFCVNDFRIDILPRSFQQKRGLMKQTTKLFAFSFSIVVNIKLNSTTVVPSCMVEYWFEYVNLFIFSLRIDPFWTFLRTICWLCELVVLTNLSCKCFYNPDMLNVAE